MKYTKSQMQVIRICKIPKGSLVQGVSKDQYYIGILKSAKFHVIKGSKILAIRLLSITIDLMCDIPIDITEETYYYKNTDELNLTGIRKLPPSESNRRIRRFKELVKRKETYIEDPLQYLKGVNI